MVIGLRETGKEDKSNGSKSLVTFAGIDFDASMTFEPLTAAETSMLKAWASGSFSAEWLISTMIDPLVSPAR
jgi:hypothetical protein